MGSGPPHRGTIDNTAAFAREFVLARLRGFEKDIQICLTPIASKTRRGLTHAYFPALGACCGIMEYLTALHRGRTDSVGWRQVSDWALLFLPQPEYDVDVVRVLIEAFRHPVAHRGIASGVWVDRNPGPGYGRRLTWKILANARRPAVRIVSENGELTRDPPWACPYTHRVHIHLRAMKVDIRNAAKHYVREIADSHVLQNNFVACMRQLYPT
jgi:hypothetical protein